MKRPGDDVHVVTTAKRKPRIITHVQKAKGKIKWERRSRKRGYAPMYLCVLLLLDCIHVYIYLRNYYRLWSPAGRCATVVSSLVVSFLFCSSLHASPDSRVLLLLLQVQRGLSLCSVCVQGHVITFFFLVFISFFFFFFTFLPTPERVSKCSNGRVHIYIPPSLFLLLLLQVVGCCCLTLLHLPAAPSVCVRPGLAQSGW